MLQTSTFFTITVGLPGLNMTHKEIKNVDHLITSLGKPGKFQVVTFLFLSCNFCIIMSNHISMVFYAAKTKYHCNVDDIQLVPTVIKNNEKQWDGCNIYAGNDTTETIPCPDGWVYYLEDGETNIISEFDLVCDDAYKSDLATTIYFCGVMLSGLLFGYIADKYGRKPVIGFTLFTSGLVGVGIFIFRNYVAFVILKFLLGFLMQGLQNSTFILAVEQFSSTHRALAGLTLGVFAAVGALGFDLIAYLIRDWKYIQLTLGILPFLQMFTLCFVPESLRWHVVDMNFHQAESIIKRTVSFNKSPFPRKLFDEVKRNSIKESHLPTRRKKANILDVFKSPKLRRITFILSIVWFTISATFYGLAFNISSLFGDKYLNFAISTLLDLVGLAVMFWAVPRYGRRRPLIFGLFSCAIANCICVVIAAVSTSANKSANILGTMMAIIAKSMIACILAIIYIFTSELYPTVVRNVSLGVNTLWTRIGGMVAPQIFFLSLYMPPYVPYTILASLTLMSGLLTVFLPETHNKPLLDRLEREEVEPSTTSHDSGNFQENEKILFVTSV